MVKVGLFTTFIELKDSYTLVQFIFIDRCLLFILLVLEIVLIVYSYISVLVKKSISFY